MGSRQSLLSAQRTHRILSAAPSDGRNVTLTIRFLKPAEEVRINAFRMISANTYVPTMNRNERNEYTVRNGILLSTGRKMPRCVAATSKERVRSRVWPGCRDARRAASKLFALGHPPDIGGNERRIHQDDDGADRTQERRHVKTRNRWLPHLIWRAPPVC